MRTQNRNALSTKELVIFAILGAIMFCSKIMMELLPNIHLVGMLTMLYTVVFRKKALIPIYLFVFLDGLYHGINLWWIPSLYIWTVLWAVTMALPRNMSRKAKSIVYPIVCCLHGLLYGTLYAPAQALIMGLNFKATMAWIIAGLPWDALHGVGNLAAGFLILPLSELFGKLIQKE